MTKKEKIDYINDYVVNECYCDSGIFIDNVENYLPTKTESMKFWRDQISKAEDEKALRKVVGLYI